MEVDDADHFPASTTSSAEIFWLISSSASATSASGGMVRGERVMTFSTGVSTVGRRREMPAQVAVGDDARERARLVKNADAAETLWN